MTRTAQRSKLFPYTTLFRSRNGIGHQSIQADGSEQQRESRKETGEHGGDALFDKCAADDLGDRFGAERVLDRKSTRLNSSHVAISYAVFCLKKKRLDVPVDD